MPFPPSILFQHREVLHVLKLLRMAQVRRAQYKFAREALLLARWLVGVTVRLESLHTQVRPMPVGDVHTTAVARPGLLRLLLCPPCRALEWPVLEPPSRLWRQLKLIPVPWGSSKRWHNRVVDVVLPSIVSGPALCGPVEHSLQWH